MWPRDGALVAYALDLAGQPDVTRNFYNFCKDVLLPEGYLLHKYNPDKSLGSSWHPWADGDGQSAAPHPGRRNGSGPVGLVGALQAVQGRGVHPGPVRPAHPPRRAVHDPATASRTPICPRPPTICGKSGTASTRSPSPPSGPA